jgi:DNA repair protein SbcD/Mre11
MLLIHAADLHLGKTLHERDLGPDQEAMLDRLLELLAERRPAALLLAGDLYDRSIPPPEAVRLFDSFLSRALAADPELAVVAIPGNHDSAARLSFGTQIMSRAGVHIRTDPAGCAHPVIIERDGERAAVWPLPFLGPDAFAAGALEPAATPEATPQGELDFDADQATTPALASAPAIRGQAELFSEAMRRIKMELELRSRSPDRGVSYNVLIAHCFAAGGSASDSERSFVGQAEEVDSSAFAAFDYVALGHLHRFQASGATGRYSGSPLAYSFAEGGEAKGFVLVELGKGRGPKAELVPVKPLRAMRRIEGPFSVLAAPGAYAEFRDDFVEARLTDALPVLNPSEPLRANFPNLLSVRQAAFEIAAAGPRAASALASTGSQRSVSDDFRAFHVEMTGSSPDEETMRLFESLAREAEPASL